MKSNILRNLVDYRAILLLQIAMSSIFILSVYRLNILPLKYFLCLLLISILLIIGLYFIIKSKKHKSQLFGKGLSFCISGCLLFVSILILKGDKTIVRITGKNIEMHTVSIIVLNDSKIEDEYDLEGIKIGNCRQIDTTYLTTTVSIVETSINTTLMRYDYNDYANLVEDLYSGEIEAIIISEAYRSMCVDIYETFSKDTKVIYSCEFEKDVSSIVKSAAVTKESFTIFISGIDTYGEVNTVARSDVNILITVNPSTKEILLTSIPRDTYITLASFGNKDKITHTGIYGIEETITSIEDWLSITINYYVRVNFSSVVNIVDMLGGITVNSPNAFTSGNYSYINGLNQMDGAKTLAFVRERYSFEDGDLERGKNQMLVVSAIINKMLSSSIIPNYSKILDAIEESFETNMSSDELTSLIKMQLGDMSEWSITTQQVEGEGSTSLPSYAMGLSEGIFVLVPNEESVTTIIHNITTVLNNGVVRE